MTDRDFEDAPLEGSVLERVIRYHPKVNSIIEAKSLLRQAYEATFGIFDYEKQSILENNTSDPEKVRPLIEVAYQQSEDFCTSSVLYKQIQLFSEKRVHEHFGLSLTEFFDLPHDICDEVLNICEEQNKKGLTARKGLFDSLNMN